LDSTASNAEGPSRELPERKSLVFRIGDDLYGCDIALVREIVRFAAPTRIPGAPPFVRGLLNFRGEVLTVLDVGIRLQQDRPPLDRGSIIVVEVQQRQAGLVVEEVIGVQNVVSDKSPAETPPDVSGIVRYLGHLNGRIVLYLDVHAFVSQSLV
jgi:purine-binding chemotaxis protein CheW